MQLVRADFRYFGLQSMIEGNIVNAQRDLFAKTLCQAYATVDQWADKTMADIRLLEDEVARRSHAAMERLRAKEAIPPVPEEGYHLKRGVLVVVPETAHSKSSCGGDGGAAAAAAAGGAGASASAGGAPAAVAATTAPAAAGGATSSISVAAHHDAVAAADAAAPTAAAPAAEPAPAL